MEFHNCAATGRLLIIGVPFRRKLMGASHQIAISDRSTPESPRRRQLVFAVVV